MTTPAHDVHPERATTAPATRRRRRALALTAVGVGVLFAAAVADIDPSDDVGTVAIEAGNTWS